MPGSRHRLAWVGAFVLGALLLAIAVPLIVRGYWAVRAANPVRRGVRLAQELNCFSCHGEQGRGGLPDPTATVGEVPAWSGGTWMMYVDNDLQIRQYILDGVSETRRASAAAAAERERMTIRMPAYRDFVDDDEVADLVAAFKVLSRMALPPADSAARRGLELAERWGCFSCHGAAGCGGLPNPGSFTGFIPGWYGADFDDLVRDREEFDEWIRSGTLRRIADGAIGRFFVQRQRVAMPAYRDFTAAELDDLWAYAQWLARTDGGHRGVERPW